MNIDKRNIIKRDDKVHNCDLVFFTKLTIRDNAFKDNKKFIEERLLQLDYIKEPLPRYSKNNDSIECLITHRIKDFNLRGFKQPNSDDSHVFNGVVNNCQNLIKSCFFKNISKLDLMRDVFATNWHPTKLQQQKEVLKKLQHISNEDNNEVVETFLTFTNQIRQFVSAVSKDFDFSNLRRATYNFDRYGLSYYPLGLEDNQINSLMNTINFEDVDKEFKINEAFANKEKEYSEEENIHFNFNLNKKIDISLTSKPNETKENLIERAKELIIKELTCTRLDNDELKKDNLSLVNSNLIFQS